MAVTNTVGTANIRNSVCRKWFNRKKRVNALATHRRGCPPFRHSKSQRFKISCQRAYDTIYAIINDNVAGTFTVTEVSGGRFNF